MDMCYVLLDNNLHPVYWQSVVHSCRCYVDVAGCYFKSVPFDKHEIKDVHYRAGCYVCHSVYGSFRRSWSLVTVCGLGNTVLFLLCSHTKSSTYNLTTCVTCISQTSAAALFMAALLRCSVWTVSTFKMKAPVFQSVGSLSQQHCHITEHLNLP
jgi:hypothetical protein